MDTERNEDALQTAQGIIKHLQLRHYGATHEEDVSLLHWWMDMYETRDIGLMLPKHAQPLGAFMSMFRHGSILVYSGSPIWYAFWFEPCFNGRAAWISNWCVKSRRGTRDQYDATWAMHTYLFAAYPTLFAMTKQDKVVQELNKLGYTAHDTFPKLFDEKSDATIMSVTYPHFLASKFNSIRS